MNKIFNDAYKNYEKEWMKENPPFSGPYTNPCLTKEEFIKKHLMETKTTSIDRDGNLSIIGSAGFNGTLLELKKLIDNTISEYGEKTECSFNVFTTKGYPGAHIIITKVKK